MIEEIAKQFNQIVANFDRDKLEEEVNRRDLAAQELQKLIQHTNLLNGGTWTIEDLANSVKIQKKIHNINPIILPKFIGNYNYNVNFKGYAGSEKEFIDDHPELEGSSGHPPIDIEAFSRDLRNLLTSSGTEFIQAYHAALDFLGAGIAIISGYLYMYRPEEFALVNGASIGGFESVFGKLKTKEINHYYGLECNSRDISIEKPDATVKRYMAYTYLFRQLTEFEEIKNFHFVDSLLWTISINQKKDHYFAISFGEEDLSKWENYIDRGYHAIGWEIDQDLTALSEEEISDLYSVAYPDSSANKRASQLYSITKFVNLEKGDKIFANKGKSIILGAGTIRKGYYYEKDDETFRHRVDVDWFETNEKNIPEQSGWMSTLKVLSKGQFNDILKYTQDPNDTEVVEFFTPEMFEWFEQLSANPTKQFVQETRFNFDTIVNNPFKLLIEKVAGQLDKQMLNRLETTKHVRASILKNDYGKGGAYDYLWFAFYPKGSSRIRDAQLFFTVNKDHIDYGFSLGEYAKEAIRRFQKNVLNNKNVFLEQLKSIFELDGIKNQVYNEKEGDSLLGILNVPPTTEALGHWLDSFTQEIRVRITKEEALKKENLIADIADTFKKLYPIWQYAVEEDIIDALSTGPEYDLPDESDLYHVQDFATETYWKEADVQNLIDTIYRKKNIVLYGPPGTGKTFLARKLAQVLVEGRPSNIKYIQFHQSYAYEDFIEGIRPQSKEDTHGNTVIEYPIKPGLFRTLCIEAAKHDEDKYVLIIDEFNRGNISKIFGELLYLLEYRDAGNSIQLPYSKGEFFIPDNLLIIATMNTADKSLTHIDFAMRRRFAFIRFDVDTNVLLSWGQRHNMSLESVVSLIHEINDGIGDENYHIGISYFMKEDLPETIESIWRYEIYPYLEDYFLDNEDNKTDDFTWEKVKVKLSDILP
jgi:5-methylcytosine-specific restriction enzyme B